MIESNNKDYGFYATLDSSRVVHNLKEKVFDAMAQMLVTKFKLSEGEAAYVLDSRIGRHLADVVSSSESIQSMTLSGEGYISKWWKDIKSLILQFRSEMSESSVIISKLLESSESFLSKPERTSISNSFHKDPILSGNDKVRSLGQAVSRLSQVMSDHGFVLDMVSGDLLLGEKGSRLLSFRRALPPGSDAFSEGPEVENTRVSFNWDNLNDMNRTLSKSYEVIVYLT